MGDLETEPDRDDADDALRCLCIIVGSTSGRFANRAKSDNTGFHVTTRQLLGNDNNKERDNIPSTIETTPRRIDASTSLPFSVTKTRCALAKKR